MRRKQLIWFLAAGLFFVACERSSEMTSAPEVATPKITRSSKISISEAIEVAMEGLSMLDDTKTRSQQRVVDPSNIEAYVRPSTRSGAADTLFYVVNFADSAGFAIIAADPAASPQLLAVAESGSYSPNGIFEDDDRRYGDIREDKRPFPEDLGGGYYPPDPDPDPKPDMPPHPDDPPLNDPDTVVTYSDWITAGPYLEVKWGQKAPYNTYCDYLLEGTTGVKCPTGCAATALAQIMSYYQYPNEDTDALPITFPSASTDFSYSNVGNNLLLNWTELKQHVVTPSSAPCSCSETNHTNLAILFRQLGHLLDMKYDSNESSTDFYRVAEALIELGYTCNPQDDYNWDIVRGELDSARLVAMSGVRVNEEGKDAGHVWVIDGYKIRTETRTLLGQVISQTDHKYLHINWGGSGNGDGYYWADPFSAIQNEELDDKADGAEANSNNYNKELSIITGIKSSMLNEE